MATMQATTSTAEYEPPLAAPFTERARDMVPALRARGGVGDRDRRLPDETVEGLLDAGLLQMLAPRRAGGAEASVLEFLDATVELGRGDGATAWVFGILGSHHWVASHFPADGQRELFGPRGEALFPLTFSGKGGTARRVEGGYRVDGHWSFASGVDFSIWVGALAQVEGEAPGTTVNIVMRRDEVEIVDNWFTAGMRGTGSRDFIARDVFVPEGRTLLQADLMSGRTPGAALHPDYVGLRVPLHVMLLVPTLGAALGLARHALDAFIDFTKGRVGYGGIDHGGKPITHVRIGHCEARWDAVHTRSRSQYGRVADMVHRGEKIPAEMRLALRRDAAYAAGQCADIVHEIVGATGARAQHESSAFQLIQRDINTVRTHVILDQDDANELYGRHVLGLDVSAMARQ